MKITENRGAIAKALVDARNHDRHLRESFEALFYRNRSGETYLKNLSGLAGLLKYAGKKGGAVLDLGTGNGKGLNEIKKSLLGQNLNFMGTGIIQDHTAKNNLGSENYFVTTSANLKEIPNSSVGAVISVYGDLNALMSAEFMEKTADRLNEVLVPGGAIKFNVNILTEGLSDEENARRQETLNTFISSLRSKGFGIATAEASSTDPELQINLIVLAIKPEQGSNPEETAKEILSEDFNTLDEQTQLL